MRHLVAITALLAAPLAWAAPSVVGPVGDGLKINTESSETWSPWQARVAVTAPALPLWSSWGASSPSNMMLAGDRYFGWGRLGDAGGLRATGALLLGPAAMAPTASTSGIHGSDGFWRGIGGSGLTEPDANTAVPYLGLGYSAWWARTGLGVSADLGVAAQRPGQAVRFGRALSGNEGFEDVLRAMQIAPMLQVNLSYAF
ncbi:MAG TPA: hypothetical protein VGQ91_03890 [Ideonella sp.]|nr:hypothetical protein [Ideonella sp.]